MKRKIICCLSIILLLVLALGCIFMSKGKEIIQSNKYKVAQSEYNKGENQEETDDRSKLVNLVGDIQEKNENNTYNVELQFSAENCIKNIYDITDENNKKSILTNNEEIGQSIITNYEMSKNVNYKFEVEMASGFKIPKQYELISAELKLGTAVKNSDGTYSFPNFQINNPCGDEIKYATIQFASEIQSGDKLSINNVTGASINSSNTLISINLQNQNIDDVQTAIRNNLKVTLVDRDGSVSIKGALTDNITSNTMNYCVATGHYYEFVPGSISWVNAKDEAETRTFEGMKGYLATITSATEQQFIASLIDGDGWLGGTCDYQYIFDKNGNRIYNSYSESVWNWYWVTGPEAGEKFWARGENIDAYSNWNPIQPDNAAGEYYLQLYKDTGTTWNDLPMSHSNIRGYIVEYGEMPGDNVTLEESYSDIVTILLGSLAPKPELNLTLSNWQEQGKQDELFTQANQLLGTAGGRSYYKSNDTPAIAVAYYLQGAEFMLISPIEDGTIGWCTYDPSHPSSDYDSDEITYNGLKFYYRPVNYIFIGGQPLGDVYCINLGNVSSREEAVQKGLDYYYYGN